jgi:hypothetical protein
MSGGMTARRASFVREEYTFGMNDSNAAKPPPFVFSRESKIRIDRDGNFWHEGERVEHEGLARGLASWLTRDAETGRFILRNTMDWCFITVDDAPLVVRSVTVRDDGSVTLALSDGTVELLDPSTLRLSGDDVPYCDVKSGLLPARFARTAAFTLLERAKATGEGGYVLALPGGGEHALKRG